jgi:hypothetical protein
MRARSRDVRLANGGELQTPLLVPSVSSAGFKSVERVDGSIEFEWAPVLDVVRSLLTDALLISAYDIAHGHLPGGSELFDDFSASPYAEPKTLFIDSGLYEKAYGPPPFNVGRKDWTPSAYDELVGNLDAASHAVLVNYDGYDVNGNAPFVEQIQRAQLFFAGHVGYSQDLLIKPEKAGRPLEVGDLSPNTLARLKGFDVVGFTEKDLGDSVLDKLRTLARLRDALDGAGVDAPIHLFGSLDPVMTPLYHAAGAEIFDGLTWLRYGYHWEVGMYRDDVPILNGRRGLSETTFARTTSTAIDNLGLLRTLRERMQLFATTGRWDIFGERIATRLEAAYDMATKAKV